MAHPEKGWYVPEPGSEMGVEGYMKEQCESLCSMVEEIVRTRHSLREGSAVSIKELVEEIYPMVAATNFAPLVSGKLRLFNMIEIVGRTLCERFYVNEIILGNGVITFLPGFNSDREVSEP